MTKVKRKSRRVKKSRNRILYMIAGLVIAIFIFTAGTMAIMVSDEIEQRDPPKTVREPHLYVEDVFFMKAESYSRADEEEKIELTTTVYITNDGLAKADSVKIVAYPIDQAKNLALDKCEKKVGNIPIQKTSEAEFSITVPPGAKHKVELLIFENDKLLLRGSGSVMIEGTQGNTEEFETEEIKGTANDRDYDGMPDSWERYYGLNPSDPKDAFDDADGDGLNNLDEYHGNSTPAKEKDEKEDKGMLSTSSGAGLGIIVGVIIFVVIIIIVIGAVFTNNPSAAENKRSDKKQQNWVNTHNTPGNPYPPNSPPRFCSRCGGWINSSNNTCMSCGNNYNNKTTALSNNIDMSNLDDNIKDEE